MILTPQFSAAKLAQVIGFNNQLYIKREDLHRLGSHKGRSLPVVINHYAEQGMVKFVISSSGNAARAAALYIKEYNQGHQNKPLYLHIFVGKKIPLHKLKFLTNELNEFITLEQVENPKQEAFQMDKEGKAKFLRASTDDTALLGYNELAKELAEIKNLDAIFIPTSSGTGALGLHLAFKNLILNPQIHIVQTDSCHPIAGALYEKKPEYAPAMPSIAGAIVDNIAHRKDQVLDAIASSKGYGWIVSNNEIREAVHLIKDTTNLDISPNSALALAGLIKAQRAGWRFKGTVVLIFTGE